MSVKQQRGISLIELIMFIVIVSVSLTGILLVMNQVTAHSADPLIRKQALAVAESLLEEIQLQDLDPAACTGVLSADAPRSSVGCVNDYIGYSTNQGIHDFSDNAVLLTGYNVTGVAVTPVMTLGGTAIAPPGRAVQITVTVVDPTLETVSVTGYRAGR